MSGSDDDIRWLSDQRPPLDRPDPDARSRARAQLMAHAARAAHPGPVVAARRAEQTRPRRRLALFAGPRRAIAVGASIAVVAAACLTALSMVSPFGHHGIDSVLSPGVANADIVSLANTVSAAPTTGNATLVVHRNVVQGEQPFTGADLYLDNGKYYYAVTPAGLPAAVSAGPQDYTLRPMVEAMAHVSSSSPQAARAAFLKAADPEWGDDVQHEARWRQDNVIWVSGIDVLGAAYGRPAALAGMLRALATVKGVTVTRSSIGDTPTLQIAMFVPKQTTDPDVVKRAIREKIKAAGGHLSQAQKASLHRLVAAAQKNGPQTTAAHDMRATVNAHTGALLRYTDIDLVVTYHVSRVNASRYGK
jgi:hypothetical protein